MKSIWALAVLVGWACTACVSIPTRYPGHYDYSRQVYVNDTVGFQLLLPRPWLVATAPQNFTVPLALRADQEQVLEAYDPTAQLGLVIVVQQGPLLDIAPLVRRMQAVPEDQVAQQVGSSPAANVRQRAIRHIVVNGYDAAEWIYTATDTTAGLAVDITVHTYILKVGEQYVYLTFSVPTAQETTSQPAIDAILYTFGPSVST
jgi:hypothetical protein